VLVSGPASFALVQRGGIGLWSALMSTGRATASLDLPARGRGRPLRPERASRRHPAAPAGHPRWSTCRPVSLCMGVYCRSCCLFAALDPVDLDHAGARASSRRPGNARPRGGPGAALDAPAGRRRPALPPGHRVVAHGEDDGMTHPPSRRPAVRRGRQRFMGRTASSRHL